MYGVNLSGNICFRRWSGEQAAAYVGYDSWLTDDLVEHPRQ